MAEILVRVVDKGVAEGCSKAGDVISVCADNWAWSPAERTNPDWRIIRVNVLQSTVEALMAKSVDPLVKRRREWMVDFSLLPNPSLFSGARTQDIISLTKKQVQAAIVKKAK